MDDSISRKWLMECVEDGWIKFNTQEDENRFVHLIRDIAPSALNIATNLQPTCNQLATDTISRQAAIDAIDANNGILYDSPTLVASLKKIVNALPSAQQWIPCKTVYPEKENTRAIIQTNAGTVIIDGVYGGMDVYGHCVWRDKEGGLYWDDEIVAWMPVVIPEPWKGDKNENN